MRLAPGPRRWIGVSTETKPIPGQGTNGNTINAADVTEGSTFFETDTGLTAIWNGTTWVSQIVDAVPAAMQSVIVDELTRIRRLLEVANDLDSNDLI